MKKIKVGSDFSGVGAFDQALIRLGIDYKTIFACDMDKYARQTYILNYGHPNYYPENVYSREIPIEGLDIYMTSPPCQAFSLAGKRKGEDDNRGVLFYNSHEFIQKNKPRYFIFENVKGLLSDDSGKTFQRWIDYLGGKSVNGNPVIFPHEESTPYHVYYQVLNAKHYGVPQNRERVFIIGIRDDEDNDFSFPKPFHLTKRLKDVLESEVDEKYFLSDKMIESITYDKKANGEIANLNKGGERGSVYSEETDAMSCLSATDYKQPKQIQIGAIRGRNVDGGKTEQQLEMNDSGLCNSLTTVQKDNVVIIPAPIVEYQLKGGKWDKTHEQSGRVYDKNGISPTIHTMGGGNQEPKIFAPEVFQLNPSTESGGKQPYQQNRVYDVRGVMTTLDTDSGKKSILVPTNNSKGYDIAEEEEDSINFSNPNSETRRGRVGHGVAQTLDTSCNQGVLVKIQKWYENENKEIEADDIIQTGQTNMRGERIYKTGISPTLPAENPRVVSVLNTQRIRRLTPKECFSLMDFNEDFKWDVSDSQAYKQAGNSIVVNCLVEIISKLKI